MTYRLARAAAAAVAIFLLLSACVAGPRYSEIQSSIPAVKAGEGRIWVYRPSAAAPYPMSRTFVLDGNDVAETYYNTVFYVDVSAGRHTVSYLSPSGKVDLAIDITSGGNTYLRYLVEVKDQPGLNDKLTNVVVVPEETAKGEIATTMVIEAKIRSWF